MLSDCMVDTSLGMRINEIRGADTSEIRILFAAFADERWWYSGSDWFSWYSASD